MTVAGVGQLSAAAGFSEVVNDVHLAQVEVHLYPDTTVLLVFEQFAVQLHHAFSDLDFLVKLAADPGLTRRRAPRLEQSTDPEFHFVVVVNVSKNFLNRTIEVSDNLVAYHGCLLSLV